LHDDQQLIGLLNDGSLRHALIGAMLKILLALKQHRTLAVPRYNPGILE
jgi:hypothetical protein